MSEIEAPKEQTAIVRVNDQQDIFAIFDQLDDAAIVNELEGRLVESAVYHFDQGGKQIWGLAKTGVDWCATELEKKGYIIRDEELAYAQDPTDPTYMLFTAKVGKYFADTNKEVKVDAAIGTKRQWTKMKRQDGSVMADTFWFEKGSQKAIRNARMRLISEETKSTIIALAKQGGRVKEVKEVKQQSKPPVKPQNVITEEKGLGVGAASANVVPPSTVSPTKPDPKPQAQITLTLSNGKLWTGNYSAALEYFAKIRKQLGDEQYYAVLGGHGYEHSNQIPYVGMDDVFGELIMVWKDRLKESADAEPFPEKY